MKLTQGKVRKLIREEYKRASMQRLDELFAGSSAGSYIKQGVAKLWEADHLIQRALAEVDTNEEHAMLQQVHKAIEQLAFSVHDKAEALVSGSVNPKPKKKGPLPTPKG